MTNHSALNTGKLDGNKTIDVFMLSQDPNIAMQEMMQALDALRAPVFEDKVVDFILELASVSETPVSIEALTKEEDEDESYLEKKKAKKGGEAKPKAKKKA